jgi:hypothetical protein
MGMWFAAIVLIIATMLLGGCEQKDCTEHSMKVTPAGDTYLCENGRWVRYDNKNPRPPIKA